MTGTAEPQPSGLRSRVHFHWALGGILVPLVSVPVSLVLAIIDLLAHDRTPEDRRWARRLAALVALDLLVLAPALAWWVTREGLSEDRALSGQVAVVKEPVRIGVMFPPADGPGSPPIVHQVVRGYSAARSGVRPGDLVTAIDSIPVATQEEMRSSIAEGDWGVARTLTVLRDGTARDIVVVPRRPEDIGLFEAVPGEVDWRPLVRTPWDWIAVAAVMGLAWLKGRRGPPGGARIWLGFILVMVLSLGGVGGAVWLLHRFQGGFSKGALLIALWIQMALFLAGAAIVSRRSRPAPSAAPPDRLPPWKAAALGVLYLFGGGARITVVLAAADGLLFGGTGLGASNPVEQFARAGLGVAGTLLLFGNVVLLGPVAEEVLFRGYLLPRLVTRLGTAWALWTSAAVFALLHPHYRLYVLLILFLGWILGWARVRSGGLAAPIALHVLINAFASVQILAR